MSWRGAPPRQKRRQISSRLSLFPHQLGMNSPAGRIPREDRVNLSRNFHENHPNFTENPPFPENPGFPRKRARNGRKWPILAKTPFHTPPVHHFFRLCGCRRDVTALISSYRSLTVVYRGRPGLPEFPGNPGFSGNSPLFRPPQKVPLFSLFFDYFSTFFDEFL